MTTAASDRRVALYRLFNSDDALLYVGITVDPKTRWSYHSREKAWWPEVARKSTEWFETREQAEAEEVSVIVSELPRYNVDNSTTRQRGDAQHEYVRYEPIKQIRIPDDLWQAAGDAAAAMGVTRSSVVKQFLRWYIRKPGATLPPRPAADECAEVRHSAVQKALWTDSS